ncbi:MAG: sigma-70 family RNA polymerase sigma factor [Anaerolineae bacterium]|nr:sigma-70 family RNA polymerase sigma factor [Pseudomonadota bacterium]MDK1028512.1 sigma-70 family RNA polymerase sigma factor [Anaerolineae bacterium]MDK1081802.1 sigma-70 family RNA polymerase sigma factor [Anaerolineae bacterium]MDK1117805.1 sigma-70 family RNA polymerase sigma factor [Anaerolineae bacterium]
MTSYSDTSDNHLVQQFIQGDMSAFDSLYTRHIKTVYNRVRYVVPETDVEDVTQEVFIAALSSLPSFRGEAQFSTWLRTLTNHKVAEYYRRRSRKKETMQVDMVHAERRGDQNHPILLEDRITIQRALNKLPEQYREVILLRFAEGMQFKEIADSLKQNPEATKSLFRRAIATLRNTLDVKDDPT